MSSMNCGKEIGASSAKNISLTNVPTKPPNTYKTKSTSNSESASSKLVVSDSKLVEKNKNEKYHKNNIQKHTKPTSNNRANSKRWVLNDFQMGRNLGRGRLGPIYLAKERQSNYIIALKILFKEQIMKYDIKHQIRREIEIQSHLKHPHILRLYGYFYDERRFYMVLELAPNGSLFDKLEAEPLKRLDEKSVATYVSQVADALNYCHNRKVMHRDVRPEKLLIGFRGEIKLADFGMCVHELSSRRETWCGIEDYLAPEIIKKQPYEHSVDRWNVGVLTYECLIGQPPFRSSHMVCAADYNFPSYVSGGARDLISKLLVVNPDNRISMLEVMNHPWIVQNRKTELSGCQ